MSRRESMATQYKNNTNDLPKKYRLGTVSKSIFLEGLNQFHSNNFQNALPSDLNLVPEHKQNSLPSFCQEKYHLFGITQVLYRLTLNSHKSLLSRYTAGSISDSNKHRICSKVNIDKNITLLNSQVCLNDIFCALVDSSQPAMAMLFEYSGSLAQHLT